MKKNLEKIFASCSIVVAIILIMVLVVTAFGGIEATEFESKLVQGLIVTLAILYLVLAVVSLVLIFVNSDVVKEITLRQEKGGSVRVSANVVTKLVKQTCKQVEGVKCQKVALVSDEYGVRLKVNVKVVDKDVIEAETYLRTLLEDVFFGEFGFKFSSIEIKVMALTPKYKADQAAVQAKVEKKLEEMNAQEAKSGSANETENVEEIVTEETSAETEEAQEEAQDCADAQCDEAQDESAEEVADDANEDVESESAEENQSEEETATENEAE
jgi:cytochrome c biogenesis factor